MKSALKKNWYKILSVVCVISIASFCLISGISVSASSVAFQDLVAEIVSLTPAQTFVEYASVIYDVYLYFFEDGVMSDREIARLNIQAAWKTFTDNSSFTADEFSEYWDNCINELGIADDRLILIEETIRLGFTKEEIIAYCYESDGDGISVSDTGDVQVTGSSFKKNCVDYWSEYYKPMPTTTQYMCSYQTFESTDTSKPYSIDRDFPIYMNANGSWGKKNWSGVYVLSFFKDDDLSGGTFFPTYYFHFYSTKSDDGTVTIHCDTYSLEDNSLASSKSFTWDISTYPYVAFYQYLGTSTSQPYNINFYKSYVDYMGRTNSKSFTDFNHFSCGYFINTDYTTTNATLPSLAQSVTFTPESNKNDDYGVYLSSEPFQLFSTQTSIDFEKIPDNYIITINGDTIYDYSITNPDTGDTSTINEYVTNNYTYITNNNGDDSGGSSGTSSGDVNVGGNVTVSGDVNVGGEISIKADPIDINVNTQPIDINVNVSGGGSSGSSSSEAAGVQFDQDVSLNNYYDWMNEQTSGFSGFMSQFFSWLPAEIVIMLCAGFACVILARFLGR